MQSLPVPGLSPRNPCAGASLMSYLVGNAFPMSILHKQHVALVVDGMVAFGVAGFGLWPQQPSPRRVCLNR